MFSPRRSWRRQRRCSVKRRTLRRLLIIVAGLAMLGIVIQCLDWIDDAPVVTHVAAANVDTWDPWELSDFSSMDLEMEVHGKSSELLPTYWINLDRSTDRFDSMTKQFQELPTGLDPIRLPARDIDAVKHMHAAGLIQTPGSTLLEGSVSNQSQHYSKHEYFWVELAVTMSHATIIQKAYEAGHEMVLVLEDDAYIAPEFIDMYKDYVATAPKRWEVLHMMTISHLVRKRLAKVKDDPWTQYHPENFGSLAHIIHRRGMEKILQAYHHEGGVWKFIGKRVVAENFLYGGTNVYEATYSFFGKAALSSTINGVGDHLAMITAADEIMQQVTSRLKEPMPVIHPVPSIRYNGTERGRGITCLIFTSIFIGQKHDFSAKLARLVANVRSTVVPLSPYWTINVVLPGAENAALTSKITSLFSRALDHAGVHPSVYVVKVRSIDNDRIRTYNKYLLIAELVKQFADYDYFIQVDPSMNLVGYPWQTFFERQRLRGSVITGTLQQNKGLHYKDEGALDNKFFSTLAFNSFSWIRSGSPTKVKQALRESYLTDVVPQYFAVMDSYFAEWFFAHTSINTLLFDDRGAIPTSYGPNLMACGAANDWLLITRPDLVIQDQAAEVEQGVYKWHNRSATQHPHYTVPCAMSTNVMERFTVLDDYSEGLYDPLTTVLKAPYKGNHAHWFSYSHSFRKEFTRRIRREASGELRLTPAYQHHMAYRLTDHCCSFHEYV